MDWAMSMRDAWKEGFREGQKKAHAATILAFADVLSPEELAARFQIPLDFVRSVIKNGGYELPPISS